MTLIRFPSQSTEYHRFAPARRVQEYVGQAGPYFGLALPHAVYEALAEQKVHGGPPMYVVQGEWRRSDGVSFLDIAVTAEWIEANTLYRRDERGQLRWTCPECGKRGGSHTKACQYE